MKDAWFWGAPWLTFNLFPILVALSSSRGDADRSLKLASPGGCTVSTMDLSEAPGLVLFRVVREGIGISQRLSATGTCAPTGGWDAHPRTRASQEPTYHHQKKITGDGRALHRKRSSGMRFKLLSVEVFSFLPQIQRIGCNALHLCVTQHFRLDFV